MITLVLIVHAVVVAPHAGAAGTITAFTLDGELNDHIARGRSSTFTPANATFTVWRNGDGVNVRATEAGSLRSFTAGVQPPDGETLTDGATYATTGAATPTTAGLSVSGDGRSCGASSTGSITIHEIAFGTGDVVESFAATYEFLCSAGDPMLFGELRYQSSVDFSAVTVEPYLIDFGYRGFTPSAPATATITNTGTTDVALGTASVTGAQSGDFTIDSDACSGAALSTGESCSVGVVFEPGATGVRSAMLAMTADTPRGETGPGLTGSGSLFTPDIDLTLSKTKVDYGAPVTVTAHLRDHENAVDPELQIFATPYGGTKRLVAAGDVDPSGNVAVVVRPTSQTSFVAQFAGDAWFRPGSSTKKTVNVTAGITGTMARHDGTSGVYRLYRYASTCPTSGRGCPLYNVTVRPNHGGERIYVTLQVNLGGGWRKVFTDRFRLNAKSKQSILFIYANRSVVGVKTRARVQFRGDKDHVSSYSDWSYFKVTN